MTLACREYPNTWVYVLQLSDLVDELVADWSIYLHSVRITS